jgi:PAS domain S-box-containing protein
MADSTEVAENLSLAFGDLPHAVVVSDEFGTIAFANASAADLFACTPAGLIGQPVASLLGPSEIATEDNPWTEFWRTSPGTAHLNRRAVVGVRNDGVMVPVEVTLKELVEGPRRYTVASLIDTSERVTLEARIGVVATEQIAFSQLVADIVGRLMTIDTALIDQAIVDSLRQIGEALQLDRAILWTKAFGESVAVPTHYWEQPADGSPPLPVPVAVIPHVMSTLERGKPSWFSRVDDVPDPVDRETFRARGLRSAVWIPLISTDDPDGAVSVLAFSSTTREQAWTPLTIERLRLVASVIGQARARRSTEAALQHALAELRGLRTGGSPTVTPRPPLRSLKTTRLIGTQSVSMRDVVTQIEQVAPTPATVLLLGETGTGKEVLAQAIHELSPRRHRPMIRVTCAAIPVRLIESELFGRERGAYTGALTRQIGRFEAAHQSTLFLDEVGELPLDMQVKLLRVVQERVIERLGSSRSIPVDVRIIAATNRHLEDAVRDNTFREDLFYRLHVFPITVPPLRDRTDDIPALVSSFVDEFSQLFGRPIDSVSPNSLRDLQRYAWPGNVRELRNVVERAVILATSRILEISAPRGSVTGNLPPSELTLEDRAVEHIRAVLEVTNWRVRGPGGAAERLGVKPTTLESRMARLGIVRPQKP